MRRWCVRWLRRLVAWLDPTPIPVEQRALVLVTAANLSVGSGEYKRHHVYARLIKEFPDVPHNQLGLAIETAVGRMR